MNREQLIVGVGCNNCAGLEFISVTALPTLPDAGKRKRLSVLQADVEGLLYALPYRFPFVEAIGGDETPAPFEGRAKRWLFADCLASRIDHAIERSRIFRPGRYNSPIEAGKFPFAAFGQPHCGHVLSWCDIIASREIGLSVKAEQFAHAVDWHG